MSNSFQCEIRARPLLLSYKPMSKLTRPILAGSLAALATLAIPFLASSSATRPHRQLSYIVQFHPDHNLQAGIAAVQKTAHASLYRELPIISGASFTMDPGQLDAVRALPGVAAISEEATLEKTMFDVTPAVFNGDNVNNLPWTGAGIGVAVLDSGMSNHTDLNDQNGNSRIRYSQIFTPEYVQQDTYGHGTHIAGIIGGRGFNPGNFTKSFRGIAPGVHFINMTVLDRWGQGRESDVIAAIDRTIELKNQFNIRVMNLSLGKPVRQSYVNDPLCQAVRRAWDANIVVVVSAGNEGRNNSAGTRGYGTISSPGNSPFVITVGAMRTKGTATRSDDEITSYSSKGPTLLDRIVKPDLVAPGNRIVAAQAVDGRMRNSYMDNSVNMNFYIQNGPNQWSDQYYWMSGTSMAAPVVSGAAAVLLHKDSSLTPNQVKYRLMKTATKAFASNSTSTDAATNTQYNIQNDIFAVGAGYLDITAALNNTEKPTRSAASPSARYNPTSRKVEIVNTTSTGQSLLWGDTTVPWSHIWGNRLLAGSSVLWGDSVVWGDITRTGGNSLLWGDSLVWGDKAPSAETDTLALKGDN